jgi:hypothetical protein
MGKIVFLHDRVAARLRPNVLACVSRLATAPVARRREMYAGVAVERLTPIEWLEKECAPRLQADLAASAPS